MTINQQLLRDEVKDYILLTLGLALYAAAFTVFLMPYEIVTGGVTGLSAIIYYATQFKLENTYMIINVALLGVALKILGLKFMMKTIYAIIVLYFMLKFAQELMPVDASEDIGRRPKVYVAPRGVLHYRHRNGYGLSQWWQHGRHGHCGSLHKQV